MLHPQPVVSLLPKVARPPSYRYTLRGTSLHGMHWPQSEHRRSWSPYEGRADNNDWESMFPPELPCYLFCYDLRIAIGRTGEAKLVLFISIVRRIRSVYRNTTK